MVAKNDITKARLVTGVPSEQYKINYDRIFGKKQENTHGKSENGAERHSDESQEREEE